MSVQSRFFILIFFLVVFSPSNAGWTIPGTNTCLGFGCPGGPKFENVVGSTVAGGYYQVWGEAGRVLYPAAAENMMLRHPISDSERLDQPIRDVLDDYFGPLAQKTRFTWGATLLDKIGGGKFSISVGSGGQAFRYHVYLKENKPQSYSFETIKLIIHELVHVSQYEKYRNNFGYHYFKEYAEGGSIYENNDMEREAGAYANKIINEVYKKLPNRIKTGLKFCNKTDKNIFAALGYYQKASEGYFLVSPEEWFSEGWWNIKRNECARVRARIKYRYYYVYATGGGRSWTGEHTFCTTSGVFDIKTRYCDPYGYDSRSFIQIDTGDNNSYTFNISLSRKDMANKLFDALESEYSHYFPSGSKTKIKVIDGKNDYYRTYPSTDSGLYVNDNVWYYLNSSEYKKYKTIYESFNDFVK